MDFLHKIDEAEGIDAFIVTSPCILGLAAEHASLDVMNRLSVSWLYNERDPLVIVGDRRSWNRAFGSEAVLAYGVRRVSLGQVAG